MFQSLNNQNKPEKHQALPPRKKEFVHFINGHMFMFCFLHMCVYNNRVNRRKETKTFFYWPVMWFNDTLIHWHNEITMLIINQQPKKKKMYSKVVCVSANICIEFFILFHIYIMSLNTCIQFLLLLLLLSPIIYSFHLPSILYYWTLICVYHFYYRIDYNLIII